MSARVPLDPSRVLVLLGRSGYEAPTIGEELDPEQRVRLLAFRVGPLRGPHVLVLDPEQRSVAKFGQTIREASGRLIWQRDRNARVATLPGLALLPLEGVDELRDLLFVVHQVHVGCARP